MTSKEQERKALEQIRKIVDGLGEDSYVATAFAGCFEIAQQNIDNDWACSMQDRAESAERKVSELQANLDHLAAVKNFLADKVDAYEAQVKELNAKLAKANDHAADLEGMINEYQNGAVAMNDDIAGKDEEIAQLNQKVKECYAEIADDNNRMESLSKTCDKLENQYIEARDALTAKDNEIMMLKARLYDLLVK